VVQNLEVLSGWQAKCRTGKCLTITKGSASSGANDGPDVCVHYSAIAGDGYRTLQRDPVEYEIVRDPKGPQAANVSKAGAEAGSTHLAGESALPAIFYIWHGIRIKNTPTQPCGIFDLSPFTYPLKNLLTNWACRANGLHVLSLCGSVLVAHSRVHQEVLRLEKSGTWRLAATVDANGMKDRIGTPPLPGGPDHEMLLRLVPA